MLLQCQYSKLLRRHWAIVNYGISEINIHLPLWFLTILDIFFWHCGSMLPQWFLTRPKNKSYQRRAFLKSSYFYHARRSAHTQIWSSLELIIVWHWSCHAWTITLSSAECCIKAEIQLSNVDYHWLSLLVAVPRCQVWDQDSCPAIWRHSWGHHWKLVWHFPEAILPWSIPPSQEGKQHSFSSTLLSSDLLEYSHRNTSDLLATLSVPKWLLVWVNKLTCVCWDLYSIIKRSVEHINIIKQIHFRVVGQLAQCSWVVYTL